MKALMDKLVYYANPARRRRPEPEGPRFADLNERAMASAIDVMVLYILFFSMFLWLQERIYAHVDPGKLAEARDAINSAPDAAAVIHDFPLLWASHQPQLWLINMAVQVGIIGVAIVGTQCASGTTPGKWLLGLRIVDRKTLERPARWQFVVRYFGYIVSILPLMLGIFWITFGREHRGWHDRIAGTAVIELRPRGWYWSHFKRGVKWMYGKAFPKKTTD
ncbi:MAG: RDD family protein [Alphaproteobacteria bacterium]